MILRNPNKGPNFAGVHNFQIAKCFLKSFQKILFENQNEIRPQGDCDGGGDDEQQDRNDDIRPQLRPSAANGFRIDVLRKK